MAYGEVKIRFLQIQSSAWHQWIVINSRSQRTHETESEFVPKRHGINSVKLPTLKTIEKRQRLANYGQLFFGTSSKGRLSSDNFMDVKILSRRWFHDLFKLIVEGMLLPPWGHSVFRSRFMTELTSEIRKGTDTELISPDSFPVDRFQNTRLLLRSVGLGICHLLLRRLSCLVSLQDIGLKTHNFASFDVF